jgi:hypothetical protein
MSITVAQPMAKLMTIGASLCMGFELALHPSLNRTSPALSRVSFPAKKRQLQESLEFQCRIFKKFHFHFNSSKNLLNVLKNIFHFSFNSRVRKIDFKSAQLI